MDKECKKTKYLYGAAVQGIQDFIFQTNKLEDIIGASGLVEQICTSTFDYASSDDQLIVKAAGNIKCIFDTKSKNEEEAEDKCLSAVRDFPKKVMEIAPGITISQAVVRYVEDTEEGNLAGMKSNFEKAVDTLEERLRQQRNHPVRSMNLGLMGIARSSTTGLPAVGYDNDNKEIDEATQKKRAEKKSVKKLCEKAFGNEDKLDYAKVAFDIEKMNERNDWIAIIHADGNGLGQILQYIGGNSERLREFSRNLDEATKNAARTAFEKIKEKFDLTRIIPIRPIVLSGDDLTMICRADLAVPYTQCFLESFEKETKGLLKDCLPPGMEKLTACAGIAFIKSSYPFHYGYNLAESLCGKAKSMTKKIEGEKPAPSCLLFHKVQDSFIEDYDQIIERELTTNKGDFSFFCGPYYLSYNGEGVQAINNLLTGIKRLNEESLKEGENKGLRTQLRQWITLMFEHPGMADQKIDRMNILFNNHSLIPLKGSKSSPLYDLLSLYTVTYQETKQKLPEK